MSIPPNSATARATNALTSAVSRTSAFTPNTFPPLASTDCSSSRARFSFLKYVKPTAAPSAANFRTRAFPIPRVPPVTTATFPLSRIPVPVTTRLVMPQLLPKSRSRVMIHASLSVHHNPVYFGRFGYRHVTILDVTDDPFIVAVERITVTGPAHFAQLDDVARTYLKKAVERNRLFATRRTLNRQPAGSWTLSSKESGGHGVRSRSGSKYHGIHAGNEMSHTIDVSVPSPEPAGSRRIARLLKLEDANGMRQFVDLRIRAASHAHLLRRAALFPSVVAERSSGRIAAEEEVYVYVKAFLRRMNITDDRENQLRTGRRNFVGDGRRQSQLHRLLHRFRHAASREHRRMRKLCMHTSAGRIKKRKRTQRAVVALTVLEDSEHGKHRHRAGKGIGAIHVAGTLRITLAEVEVDSTVTNRYLDPNGERSVAGYIIIERFFSYVLARRNAANFGPHRALGSRKEYLDVSTNTGNAITVDQVAQPALADVDPADLAENVPTHNVGQFDLSQEQIQHLLLQLAAHHQFGRRHDNTVVPNGFALRIVSRDAGATDIGHVPFAHGPKTKLFTVEYRLQDVHVRQVAVPGVRIVDERDIPFVEIVLILRDHGRHDIRQRAGKTGEIPALRQQPSVGIEKTGDEVAGLGKNAGPRRHHKRLRHLLGDAIETVGNDRN